MITVTDKEENYIIMSKDAEKAFDKIEHPLTKKTLSELEIEGSVLDDKGHLKILQLTSCLMVKLSTAPP